MRIEQVQATNWMSHVDSTLDPGDARFVTIRGQHAVGKTALVEAVSYALFGRGRFDTADEPVRHGATDMSVRVEFVMPDGQRYRVIRRRTTRAGGKGSLSFAVQRGDGQWMTLDGSTLRDTEAAIRGVVGVDGATFEAIAFLMQGRITALVDATAAGRRDVLVAGLLLDRWPKIQTRVRKAVAAGEELLTSKRGALDRLEPRIAELPEVEARVAADRDRLAVANGEVADARAKLEAATAEVQRLDERLAESERAADDVARLEGERGAAAEEWQRAKAREDQSKANLQRVEGPLALEPESTAAAVALPAARERLQSLVAIESEERSLQREIADVDRAIRDLEIPHHAALTRYNVERRAAEAKVDELRSHVDGGAAVCVACGQAIDDAQARAQLEAASAALTAIGDAPAEPDALVSVRASREGMHGRLGALGWDPAVLVAARDRVELLDRQAARLDELVRLREIRDREIIAISEAHADRVRAEERGTAISARLADAKARVTAAAPLREERAAAAAEQLHHERTMSLAAELGRVVDREIAAGEARVEALRADKVEVAQLRAAIDIDRAAISLDRELVDVLGEIPLRIIDASLPELEAEAQSLLDLLDPGSIVSVTGQRATVDGKRVLSEIDITFQDADGRRDVRMTSGGERVAVSVALSLGLRRVLARQHGAQLRTASIDEPDGMDRAQRLALARAVRGLIHAGDIDRAFLITHHEDLAEEGDAQTLISKNGHGSILELVT